jgi:proline iminopeptidase
MRYQFYFCILQISILLFSCNKNIETTLENDFKEINGVKIYYKAFGKGEPVLVVHGGPGLGHNYLLPYFEKLGENNRVILYDQRNSGKSTTNESTDLRMEHMVQDIEDLRKAFGIEKLHLISHSFASLFTIQYAFQFPDNIKSLTLLEPYPISSEINFKMYTNIMNKVPQEDINHFNNIKASSEFRRGEPEAVKEFLYYYYLPFYHDADKRKEQNFGYFNEEFAVKYNNTNQFINLNNFGFTLLDRLEKINCPTLVIHGESDVVPEENIKIIEQNIKKVKVAKLKNSGHFGYLENPVEYFQLIKTFLKDPEASIRN